MTPAEIKDKATQYNLAIKIALQLFGEYNYCDKGPQESMDLPLDELRDMGGADAARVLRAVYDNDNDFGESFVSACLLELQELPDDWWNALESTDEQITGML